MEQGARVRESQRESERGLRKCGLMRWSATRGLGDGSEEDIAGMLHPPSSILM